MKRKDHRKPSVKNSMLMVSKVPHPLVKFDVKPDGEVAESVPPTVLELGQNFVQKWCQSTRKLSSLSFQDRFEFGDLENRPAAVLSKSGEFDKIGQKKNTIVRPFSPIFR